MANEKKTLNLKKGEGGYKLTNDNIGPIVRFHGLRKDITCVTESEAAAMAADPQFKLVVKTNAQAEASASTEAKPSAEQEAANRFIAPTEAPSATDAGAAADASKTAGTEGGDAGAGKGARGAKAQ